MLRKQGQSLPGRKSCNNGRQDKHAAVNTRSKRTQKQQTTSSRTKQTNFKPKQTATTEKTQCTHSEVLEVKHDCCSALVAGIGWWRRHVVALHTQHQHFRQLA